MSTEIALIPSPAPVVLPALFAPTPKAARRVLEFFTAQINNDHTRAAYLNAARRFAEWCEAKGLPELADVQPFHVAAFVKELQRQFAAPTVKQHLAALRMLFDWLVTGHVIDTNPAHAVRGPRYVVRKGKTAVLAADEARALLDSIPVACNVLLEDGTEIAQPLLVGLRDRALIGVMVFTFARVNAVTQLKVKDYYTQGRRGWIRLHEKGGKEHDVPCNHALETLLDAYLAAAGIKDDPEGPLFRTVPSRAAQEFTRNPLWQQDAYRMIQRRAKVAGIGTRIGNHSFRATGITAYLKNDGLLEHAQQIAAHASPRTTKLYDRRADDITPGSGFSVPFQVLPWHVNPQPSPATTRFFGSRSNTELKTSLFAF